MSTPASRPNKNRRRSVAGVAFAPLHPTSKLEKLGHSLDKENLTFSPQVGNQKKRKARVSFANLDELVYYDTDGAALGLGGGPPAAKKLATISTPTRKRTSLAEIPASVLANKECAIEAIQSAQEDKEVHKVREAEIVKDTAATTPAASEVPEKVDEPMELEEEYNYEAILGPDAKEFTLEDVLNSDSNDFDVAALNSAADDELSAIYASGSGVRAGRLPLSGLAGEESHKIENTDSKGLDGSNSDESDSMTSAWRSLMGNRRDSLNLPTLARRDSFSLSSNRHLRSTGSGAASLAAMLPTSQSRRQSIQMDMTQSDLGSILSTQSGENNETTQKLTLPVPTESEDTTSISGPRSKSRRASLAMDMTVTDLGQIIMDEETTKSIAKSSVAVRSRRQSLMDMTVTDLGSIAVREEEPMGMDEDEAAHQTIRMELTRTDLGEFLDDIDSTANLTEVRVKLKNRRQSLAMEETQSNFGAILDNQPETQSLTQQLNDQFQDTSLLMTTVLETAEERAAKPSSNLLSLLSTAPAQADSALKESNSEQSTKTFKKRRQSLAMDMTVSNFGEILDEPLLAASETEKPNETRASVIEPAAEVEEAMEMTQNFDASILASTGSSVPPTPAKIASTTATPSKATADEQDEAMEMTTNFTSHIALPEVEHSEAPLAEEPIETIEDGDDTVEIPVPEGVTIIEKEEETAVPAITVTAPSNLSTMISEVSEKPNDEIEAPSAHQMEEANLLGETISNTTSFPNLSMSLSSRDGLRSIIESAVAQSTISEKEKENTTSSISLASMRSIPSQLQAQATINGEPSNTTTIPLEGTLLSDNHDDAQHKSEFASQQIDAHGDKVEGHSDEMDADELEQMNEIDRIVDQASSRRGSRRSSVRFSFLDTIVPEEAAEEEEVTEDLMSVTQMNNFLAESTQHLAKRSNAVKSAKSGFSLLASLAPGSPLMDGDRNDAPLIAALHSAIPTVVPRAIMEIEHAPENIYPGDNELSIAEDAEGEVKMPEAASEHSTLDRIVMNGLISSVSGHSEEDETMAAGSGEADDVDLEMDIDEDSMPSEELSNQLELAQKQFESHVEAQLRTPGVRKSLLAASTFTPFSMDATNEGGLASGSKSAYQSGGSGSTSVGMMTLSNLSSTTLARFLSSYGVHFLDGISNRRQSLGVRVPEPHSDFDRMLSSMKSQPELELTQRVFIGLTSLLGDCERRLADLEDQCRQQCSAKTGVYELFVQCLTTHQTDARKDMALLKQLAQAEAKFHLNERYVGHYFEDQLYQTLQITHATAKDHLAYLLDQQTATTSTKLAMAKNNANVVQKKVIPSKVNQVSATPKQVEASKKVLATLEASDDFLKSVQGWMVIDSGEGFKVMDYRKAIEMRLEMKGLEISGITLTSVLGAKTEEEDEERQFVEKMLSTIDLSGYIGSTSVVVTVNEITTKLGRILDLSTELRQLQRAYYFESSEVVPNVGVALSIRFSNPLSGIRFVTKFEIGTEYPFVDEMPIQVDTSFGHVDVPQVVDVVNEEVEKCTYKLMTRLCKRLYRLCSEY